VLNGFLIAILGLFLCPIWISLRPDQFVVGYLAGLGLVGLGVLMLVGSLIRDLRSSRGGGRPMLRLKLTLAGIALFCAYLSCESSASLYLVLSDSFEKLHQFRLTQRNEAQLFFTPHPFLQYTLNPESEGVNSYGFYGPEWTPDKPARTIRVTCLGGSTTADGYPESLGRRLKEKLPDRPIEVMNFGVSGWSSAHSLVNFNLNVRHVEPDLPHDHRLVRYLNSYALAKWKLRLASGKPLGPPLEHVMFREQYEFDLLVPMIPKVMPIFKKNMEAIITLARADGSDPILMTQPYPRTDIS